MKTWKQYDDATTGPFVYGPELLSITVGDFIDNCLKTKLIVSIVQDNSRMIRLSANTYIDRLLLLITEDNKMYSVRRKKEKPNSNPLCPSTICYYIFGPIGL